MPISKETTNDEQLHIESYPKGVLSEIVEEPPTICYEFVIDMYNEALEFEEEITDKEILDLPTRVGMFSFLNNVEEDIYDESDGDPIE